MFSSLLLILLNVRARVSLLKKTYWLDTKYYKHTSKGVRKLKQRSSIFRKFWTRQLFWTIGRDNYLLSLRKTKSFPIKTVVTVLKRNQGWTYSSLVPTAAMTFFIASNLSPKVRCQSTPNDSMQCSLSFMKRFFSNLVLVILVKW